MPDLGSMTPLQGGPFAPQQGQAPLGPAPAWGQPFNPAAFASLFGGQQPGNLFSLLFHGGPTPGGVGASSPTEVGPSPVRGLSSNLPSLFAGPQAGGDMLAAILSQVFRTLFGGQGGAGPLGPGNVPPISGFTPPNPWVFNGGGAGISGGPRTAPRAPVLPRAPKAFAY